MIFPPGGLSGSAVNCRGNNQNPGISHRRNRKAGGKDTGTAAVENWDQAPPNQWKQRLTNKAFGTSLLGFIGKGTSLILAIKSGWYSSHQPGAGASPGAWPGAWAWQRALPSWESVCHRAVALAIQTLPTCPFTRQDGFSLQQIMFFSIKKITLHSPGEEKREICYFFLSQAKKKTKSNQNKTQQQ